MDSKSIRMMKDRNAENQNTQLLFMSAKNVRNFPEDYRIAEVRFSLIWSWFLKCFYYCFLSLSLSLFHFFRWNEFYRFIYHVHFCNKHFFKLLFQLLVVSCTTTQTLTAQMSWSEPLRPHFFVALFFCRICLSMNLNDKDVNLHIKYVRPLGAMSTKLPLFFTSRLPLIVCHFLFLCFWLVWSGGRSICDNLYMVKLLFDEIFWQPRIVFFALVGHCSTNQMMYVW